MPETWEPRSASGGGTTAHRRPGPGTRTGRVSETISSAVAVEQVQASMRRYKQPEESVVDEFLAERRMLWGEE